MKSIVLVCTLILMSLNAYAWDGAASGTIKYIDIAPNDTRTFRVILEGNPAPALCGSALDWAYLHPDDVGYASTVSILLAAKMSKASVTLYANANPNDNNYCKIGYVRLH